MWFKRRITEKMAAAVAHFPVLVVTGARQTGKSSLLANQFPALPVITLDVPSLAEDAEKRPTELLNRYRPPLIIDEVQYAPSLFRHLKVEVDRRHQPGQFLLTGSQKFTLTQAVSESLAGRCAVMELGTLSAAEFADERTLDPEQWLNLLFRGGYPAICAEPARSAADYYRSYVATYLERDVRNLLNVGSLRDFDRFLRLAASRNGSLLNYTEMASVVGVAATTIKSWVSVLQASGIAYLLEPYFNNVGKRLVKTPKLYFRDTGLLCHLLALSDPNALLDNILVGSVWETFILNQLLLAIEWASTSATVWFWRDAHGLEVDFLVDLGNRFELIECKWTEAPGHRDVAAIEKVAALIGRDRKVGLRVACRTPHPFAVTQTVTAVNGFTERDWLASTATL